MRKSVKIRKIIFEILYEIKQKNINFDESYSNYTKNIFINDQDKSMIYNIVLNSIRNNFFIQSVLKKYLEKKTSIKIKILLLSAITQILYLDFKGYAVTNDTVEVAKIKKLNPGLVNALLKNVIINNENINKKKIEKSSIPNWFTKTLNKNGLDINKIINNISKEPSLHLVFKNEKYLKNFNEHYVKTTSSSAFVQKKRKVTDIENYLKGHWWVQDLASMLPIYLSPEFKSKKIIDMCSAPGGKSFQLLSQKNDLVLNDINSKRIDILNNNLNRLNFNGKVTNVNALNISENKSYDVVVLDSPCSGVGTLRRNPEILFKKKPPNLNLLIEVQKNLIDKATKLLKNKGTLIYMVCSFFYEETKDIKHKFLKKNKNFSQQKFELNKKNEFYQFVDGEGDILCLPTKFKDHMIDGFYAVKFIRND
tara:strand:- start:2800 stop:4065 length:1266 start_codon:yes stop_codon:yes gene_type:complete